MRLLILFLILAAGQTSLADEKTVLAIGDWSEVTDGLRGRLILAQGRALGDGKIRESLTYVELESTAHTHSGVLNVHFDPDDLKCELTDTRGEEVSQTPMPGSGGRPGKTWVTIPDDSLIRLRANPYAFGRAEGLLIHLNTGSWLVKDDADYTFAGKLTITPPEGHGKSEVWKGVLVLPKVKFSLRNIHARLNVNSDPLAALRGVWEVISVVVNGAPGEPNGVPASERPTVQWVVMGQQATIRVAGADESSYLLSSVGGKTIPTQLDLRATGLGAVEGTTFPAIFEVVDGTLRICYALDGPRPDAFTADMGSNRRLLTFRRVELTAKQKETVDLIVKRGGKVEEDLVFGGLKVVLGNGDSTDSDLEQVKNLPSLVSLDMNYAGGVTDQGLRILKGMINLRILSLVGTRITDEGMKTVATLSELRSLELSGGVTDAGLERLKGLTRLEYLGVGETRITDAGLSHLKGMTGLRKLNLRGLRWRPEITDVGMAHLAELKGLLTLTLAGRITDDGLKHLEELTELRSLDLNTTSVGDAGLFRLKTLTALEILCLPGSVSDNGLSALAPLTKLRELSGLENVTDAGMVHLKGLKELRSLHFWYAQISGAGLKQLEELKELRTLRLVNVPLGDDDLEGLKGLSGLTELSLTGSKVTDRGLEHLKGLVGLKTLDLSESTVTAEGAAALRKTLAETDVQRRR